MSYILDALQKSERQRRKGHVPDLGAAADTDKPQRPTNTFARTAAWMVGIVLTGGLLAVLIWWLQPMSAQPPRPTADLAAPPPAQTNQPQPATRPNNITTAPPQTDNIQDSLPDLNFSSHIYSDDPTMRMISINDQMMKTGDMIAEDLLLEDITENGVILNFRGQRFAVDLLDAWNAAP